MLGYVYTGYGNRDVMAVKSDIDKYYSWYGVDGIFFDEVGTDCTTADTYYLDLYTHTKQKPGRGIVMLNPGTGTRECFMRISSTIVTFECAYGDYIRHFSAPNWASKYSADRFWHIIHGTPDAERIERAVRLGKLCGAGWIYVTPAHLPNPWNVLHPSAYWKWELRLICSS